jgi:Rieske Fe-S protein
MLVNRRTFLYLSTAFAAGCASAPGGIGLASSKKDQTINAGPASQYLADGVYPRYRDLGFFIVRHGAKLTALSSICTHRKCKLDVEKDKSFHCPCHDSTFDPGGKVTEGPAKRDLPVYQISTDEKGNLVVTITAV